MINYQRHRYSTLALSAIAIFVSGCGGIFDGGGSESSGQESSIPAATVEIELELADRELLAVELNGIESGATISIDEEVTVTVEVSGGTSDYTYRWYLNGHLQFGETESGITLGGQLDHAPGNYTLSVLVFDEYVLGSANVSYRVRL